MKPLNLRIVVAFSLFLAQSLGVRAHAAKAEAALLDGTRPPFHVYQSFRAPGNHFIPSGWMGDYGDIRFDDKWKVDPQGQNTAIKVNYTAAGAQKNGWAGIYWQNPPNNWG